MQIHIQPWSGFLKSSQLFLILACCRPKSKKLMILPYRHVTYVSKDARISTQRQLVMQDRTMLLTLVLPFSYFICKRLIPQLDYCPAAFGSGEKTMGDANVSKPKEHNIPINQPLTCSTFGNCGNKKADNMKE